MLRHYFPRGYAMRAVGLIEAFSLLHGQTHFKLDFTEMPLSVAAPNAYTDKEPPEPFEVSNAATLIKCGLFPPPSFAFLFKEKIILKEPVPFLARMLAGSESFVMLAARVYSYPQPLLVPVSGMMKTIDPGPMSDTEVFRQEKKTKEGNEIIYADALETYLEKQKYLITGKLEEKGVKTTWA